MLIENELTKYKTHFYERNTSPSTFQEQAKQKAANYILQCIL